MLLSKCIRLCLEAADKYRSVPQVDFGIVMRHDQFPVMGAWNFR